MKPTQTLVFQEGVCSEIRALFQTLLIGVAVLRDQRDRGRDIEGIIKQWFAFVKPNFEKVSVYSS